MPDISLRAMKNKFFRTALAVVLGLGISLAMAPSALAAYDDVQFPQASDVYLSGSGITLTVSALSNLNSITVYPTYISVILEMDAGGTSAITFTSADRYKMNNSAGTTVTCGSSTSTLALAGPTSTGTSTVTITPVLELCSGTGGNTGGGGGGGTISTPSPSPTPSPAATPSPSVSPSPSASPSPTASPTPSASPAPLALMPIPTLPANPTTTEIQTVIAALINNIAYLQAELLKLQPTTGAFTYDLYYGLWNNAEVKRMQEFMISKGYLASGLNTSNYYLKTVEAVKAYQTAKSITPVNGRFGPLTRSAANADLGL